MEHFTITFQPENRSVVIHSGATLLEAAGRAGIILNSVCGGRGICGKCILVLEPQGREVPACQYRVSSDLTVRVPASSRYFKEQILTEGAALETKLEADIYERYVRAAGAGRILGAAVDIGTTTVVASLVDMRTGGVLGVAAQSNPQSRYGADVVSRISHAATDEGLAELHRLVVECVNDLIGRLCSKAAVSRKEIYELCVVGNTTMNHLFLKLPVTQLGQAPYEAYSLKCRDLPPPAVGIGINEKGNIHTVENIAGFVGSDTVGVALATRIDSAERVTLAIDIGTNGELVLNCAGRLYAASCAAGPAFEGARIRCGSRAVEGAIEAVVLNDGDIDTEVIGARSAHSICGSGLIDAVALLLDLGVVDSTGRFAVDQQQVAAAPAAIASRVFEYEGEPAFLLSPDRESGAEVFLTQADIREVQLAKGAIRAGIRILEKATGVDDCAIEEVLLAGAFGNYIRPESALRLKMLASVPAERIKFVGNAASAGARMLLVSSRCRRQARELVKRIEYVEIAHAPGFAEIFAEAMLF